LRVANPYDWQAHSPFSVIERGQLLDDLSRQALSGAGMVLVGGHGMGKSVVLRALEALRERDGVHVLRFASPPARSALTACLRELALGLGVTPQEPLHAARIIDDFLDNTPSCSALVLLYDEPTLCTSDLNSPS